MRSKDTLMKESSRIPGRHGGLPTSMTSLSWTSGRQGSVACRSLPKDEAWYEPVEEGEDLCRSSRVCFCGFVIPEGVLEWFS